MPKSDTWPGGAGLETSGMESAGSCDSVVSANSGFSDDSLEHLSAEEKACLMFLEETIESLDTEEDSGLSNDEPELVPSLASKLADLSASMSKSRLSDSQKHTSKECIVGNADSKPVQSYLVPTPLVLAGGSLCSVSSTKQDSPPDENFPSKPQFTPSDHKIKHNHTSGAQHVHFEVDADVPPPTKPRHRPGRTPEGPSPRGPLSYEALVYLQRSASTKKTPLCPTVDHTLELDRSLPATTQGSHHGNMAGSHPEASKSKKTPPAVAPKPKTIPANISLHTQNETLTNVDSSYSIRRATDPQVVRLEALEKLGLLRDQQPENDPVAPLSPAKPYSSLDPKTKRLTNGPSNPPRTPSFCYSQVSAQPKYKPLQTSASFHHNSRGERQTASPSRPAQPDRLNVLDNGNSPDVGHIVGKTTTTAQAAPHKPSNAVGYTVMVVPGMGADRREALRKLGLLKN